MYGNSKSKKNNSIEPLKNIMVSTRGLKFKFTDGEKVLCYEPDPTKAKVLYDSKVLDVIINKDSKGKKAVEYLIHFQGWNSSWDRCVPEEYVLKDTEENRQLQRDLAEKAQLQLGAYLYRKERKKRSHKYTDSGEVKRRGSNSRATSATTNSSEDGSSEIYDTEGVTEGETESSTEDMEETSEEDGSLGAGNPVIVRPKIEIEFSPLIKRLIEHDYDLIVHKRKLLNLPMQPNVYDILESWVQYYTVSQLTNIVEKPQRSKLSNSIEKSNLDKTISDITVCRQTADGLRIYFDVYLGGLLLYNQEKEQFLNLNTKNLSLNDRTYGTIKDDAGESDVTVKEETEDTEFAHLPPFGENDPDSDKNGVSNKRVLRSSRLNSAEEPKVSKVVEEPKQEPSNLSSLASTSSRCSSPRIGTLRTAIPIINSVFINGILEKCKKWRLMTDEAKCEAFAECKPSMIYGAPHLLRLMVKVPDIFAKSNLQGPKLKALLKKFDSLTRYMEDHKEWFDDQMYTHRSGSSTEQSANT